MGSSLKPIVFAFCSLLFFGAETPAHQMSGCDCGSLIFTVNKTSISCSTRRFRCWTSRGRRVQLENGQIYGFEALLIATGAEPVRLKIEGATDSQLHYLRTFADARAIVSKATSAKRVAVGGASFIGLELAPWGKPSGRLTEPD